MEVLEALAGRAQGGSFLQRLVLWVLFWPLLLALIYQPASGVRKPHMARPVVGGSRRVAPSGNSPRA